MLLAEVENGSMQRLGRYREGLRVFAALDENQCILPNMLKQAADHIDTFAKEARAQGAEAIHLFATSAVRDARNADELATAIFNKTGLELQICSGNEEAELSFMGATNGVPSGMIDIGGGSTEIVVGDAKTIHEGMSFQMGAVRLFRMLPAKDRDSAKRVIDYAVHLLEPHKEKYLSYPAQEWIGVGGTFTTTSAFTQRKFWDDRTNIHGYVLTLRDITEAIDMLAPMPVPQRKLLPFLQPQRADIIVHGLCILAACMQVLQLDRITVSEYGNLDGYLKEKYSLSETI
jgi:exopolyphosphatase/guanosine-5'-triphosphate,3'-diphosphate pyrophosphatase